MARNVEEKQVGIAASGPQEERTEEAHDQRIPGTAGPHVNKGQVVCVDEHLAIPE
ncbi:MAG: hypothetical protein ABGW50_00905 [Thermococcus sp.]